MAAQRAVDTGVEVWYPVFLSIAEKPVQEAAALAGPRVTEWVCGAGIMNRALMILGAV